MRRRDLLAWAGTGLVTATAGPALASSLDGFRWERRLLLVFAPIRTHPNLIVQRQRLSADRAGLRDRDLTVIEAVQNVAFIDNRPTFEVDARTLRAEFGISTVQFAVVLIGKDGGEKLRRDDPVTLDELFATIDAMPMRQQEMRQDGQKT